MKIEIAPSILSADFGKLNEEIAEIESSADRIHVDVMDGHFVPNISFGAPVMKWIKSELPRDVHLMIEHPWRYFEDLVKAGASIIIVHSEVCDELGGEHDLPAVLKSLREMGVGAGVSVKPGTAVAFLSEYLDLIDQVLVMTVEPGFGGQEFMPDMLEKVRELREMGYKGDVGIDGGVNAETAKVCAEAGANLLIAGSYVFGAEDRSKMVDSLKR